MVGVRSTDIHREAAMGREVADSRTALPEPRAARSDLTELSERGRRDPRRDGVARTEDSLGDYAQVVRGTAALPARERGRASAK